MAFAKRYGSFQPFVRHKTPNDGRNGSIEAGFVTYASDDDNQETYQVSSVEVGGRSDHIADALQSLSGIEPEVLSSASPLDSDADLIRKASNSKSDKSASEASA